ncbi:MAG: hypothetical protein AB8F95_19925 [Bacteroidia bacterium]
MINFLFSSTTHDFRYINLQTPLYDIKRSEPQEPIQEDLLGLSYTYTIPQGPVVYLDYFLDEARSNEGVKSIQANVRFKDAVECDEVYKACQRLFNRRYGASTQGSYGRESWQQLRAEGLLEAHLRLSELQTVLSINLLLVPNN